MNDNELKHYGIKGQRWGVRRFRKRTVTYVSGSQKRQSSYVSHMASKGKVLAGGVLTAVGGKLAFWAAGTAIAKSTGMQAVGKLIKSFGDAAIVGSAAHTTFKLFKKDEEL